MTDVAYHDYIQSSGNVQIGRPLYIIGEHCRGYNTNSIGICLHGLSEVCFTDAQFKALIETCQIYVDMFRIDLKRIFNHREFNKNKTCPVFDVNKKLIPFLKPYVRLI